MKKLKVVFLEDNRHDRHTLKTMLQDGTSYFEVYNYDTKIIFDDQIRNVDCDVIILDIDLQHSKGLPSDRYIPGTVVAEEIRSNIPELDHVPILITSAYWETMIPETAAQFEARNMFRGIFAIGKDDWGLNGSNLIAKLCNIMTKWTSFIACSSSQTRSLLSSRHLGFEFPIDRTLGA
ncbi:MAG: hypothetical protein HS117_16665 [Verrucomicrobiaceae bacterium]|jgi:CheY-like chemotaxis protein|nr:hypothetical protein [Verrucomicrobiaceae bacterium]